MDFKWLLFVFCHAAILISYAQKYKREFYKFFQLSLKEIYVRYCPTPS